MQFKAQGRTEKMGTHFHSSCRTRLALSIGSTLYYSALKMLPPNQENGHSRAGSLHLRIYVETLCCEHGDKSFPWVSRDSSGEERLSCIWGLKRIMVRFPVGVIRGGSNMTGTDVARFTHKSVPVIFEPPCILFIFSNSFLSGSGAHPAQWAAGIFPGVNLPERQAARLFPYGAQDMTNCSCTPTTP